jgi:hypothetical protein
MRRLIALLALVAGCAGMNESPRGELMPAVSPVVDAPLAETPSVIDVEAAPVAAAPPAKSSAATGPLPPVLAPVAATLDVAALKARLRDTAAIGVLAKISLRNQMDELLESFRAHYRGAQKTSLAALRKPYDELVMKVLDMLDERDPSLARSISSSREAIWEMLTDRERFGSMQ